MNTFLVTGQALPIAATSATYPLALLAGMLSFLSPCVFPLVPAYIAYLSGTTAQPLLIAEGPTGSAAALRRTPVVASGLAFVLGFSAVFVALFYVLRALEVTLLIRHQREVNLVAGLLVILLALQTMGVLRIGAFMREWRLHLAPRAGIAGGFLLGVTFAAGWTPCIGPQLGAILQLAVGGFGGLPFMLVYCLGLAIPFLLVAALTDRLQGIIRRVNRHLGAVNLVAGALLLVFGILLLTNQFTFFNRFSGQSPFDV